MTRRNETGGGPRGAVPTAEEIGGEDGATRGPAGRGHGGRGGTFIADASKTPNRIDVEATAGVDRGTKWHGVYELEGDTPRAVVGPADQDRPAKLADPRGFTLKRAKQ